MSPSYTGLDMWGFRNWSLDEWLPTSLVSRRGGFVACSTKFKIRAGLLREICTGSDKRTRPGNEASFLLHVTPSFCYTVELFLHVACILPWYLCCEKCETTTQCTGWVQLYVCTLTSLLGIYMYCSIISHWLWVSIGVTHSYSSRPFVCALGWVYINILFNNFDWTTSFYWSYTLLLKPAILMCSWLGIYQHTVQGGTHGCYIVDEDWWLLCHKERDHNRLSLQRRNDQERYGMCGKTTNELKGGPD